MQLIHGDCLEKMKGIPDKSIDMILCDLPYGTTACKWDVVIPLEPLWEQYGRIIKDNGAIVLFGSEPFSSYLRMSNIKQYKYDWVWDKKHSTNFMLAKKQPLKYHENIIIFNSKIYYPIKTKRAKDKDYSGSRNEFKNNNIVSKVKDTTKNLRTHLYPKSIIEEHSQKAECNNINRVHPTQKPVALLEYLIKTYTQENEIVLDNCMGSGTTAIACINTNRNYIGFEMDKHYCDIANERIESVTAVQMELKGV